MTYLPTYAIGTVISLALLLTLAWFIRASLQLLLTETSGSRVRAGFWGWVTMLWIGIVGVVAATSQSPYDKLNPGDNAQLFALIGQLRLFLVATLFAVVVVAYFVARVLRRHDDRVHPMPPRYVPWTPGYYPPPAPPTT
ncbi:MAG: hypothetical protein QOE92_667 [Chloroflexota bacterium]|jgi:hypothetical protein|nr:hypothetical protein [Chloroflexota bacterium]